MMYIFTEQSKLSSALMLFNMLMVIAAFSCRTDFLCRQTHSSCQYAGADCHPTPSQIWLESHEAPGLFSKIPHLNHMRDTFLPNTKAIETALRQQRINNNNIAMLNSLSLSLSIYIYPDSLTCRPDVGRRSALIGHIGRYGRHQADVGRISGQVGHICRYGRHRADVGRRSALIGQKIGSYLPYLPIWPIWPTSGRRRLHIGTSRPYLPIWPTPGRRRQKIGTNRPESGVICHICRYGRHQADVGSTSEQIGHICRYGRH